MIDTLTQVLKDDGSAVAVTWQPTLAALVVKYGERVPDWERIYPGLIALIGFQSMLWPLWVNAARRAVAHTRECSPGAAGHADEWAPMIYTAPKAEPGQPIWRFAYHSVSDRVAWALAHGPGLVEFDSTLAILQHRDVLQTLSSLDERGRVVCYGLAPLQLLPLLGKRPVGEVEIELPICDCATIEAMLPDWRDGVEPLKPVLARAAGRLTEWRQAESAARSALTDEDVIRLGYACLAWHVWRELQDRGCFQARPPERPKGFGLFGRKRERGSFMGVLLLRGDHWELWQKVKQLVCVAEAP